MDYVVLTRSGIPVIRFVADFLGILMNGIFSVIDSLGVPNVALAIIIFTVIVQLLMTPLQVKQQRFSKLQAVMQPELKKIQDKYKNKKDTESMSRMSAETKEVYNKYGVSSAGSCGMLLIQMPILFGLYQVIYNIPGYITIIGDKIGSFCSNGLTDLLVNFNKDNVEGLTRYLTDEPKRENLIDTLYSLKSTQWDKLFDFCKGSEFESTLKGARSYIDQVNDFLGLNIANSPLDTIKTAWADGKMVIVFIAVMIPVLAWFTQWIGYKLMPQNAANAAKTSDGQETSMSTTLQSMNTIMPLFSAFLCTTLPIGLGIYWIAGAVIRAIQQLLVNRKLDKESIEDIIKQSVEKANKKREKLGLPPQKVSTDIFNASGKTLAEREKEKQENAIRIKNKAKEESERSTSYYNSKAPKPGSIAAKANMVRNYEEKNNRSNSEYKK